ncbi:hypothetical protein BD779DRAFT_1555350 [Infundibulicybe gibba]|nr:hypothetical protein BD779DRAFT_1555350 [Infundibulicybe gibba]
MAPLLRFGAFFILAAGVSAAPQLQCPICPPRDNIGESLISQTTDTTNHIQFCGYSFDTTGSTGIQTSCFYVSSGSQEFPGVTSACPSVAALRAC